VYLFGFRGGGEAEWDEIRQVGYGLTDICSHKLYICLHKLYMSANESRDYSNIYNEFLLMKAEIFKME